VGETFQSQEKLIENCSKREVKRKIRARVICYFSNGKSAQEDLLDEYFFLTWILPTGYLVSTFPHLPQEITRSRFPP